MEWIKDHVWESWLAVTSVLVIAELFSLELVLLMLAAGTAAGAVAALLGAPFVLQAVAAIAVSLGALFLVRPPVLKKLRQGPELTQGHEKLIGRTGTVLREVSVQAPGLVAFGGDQWTSVPYDETVVLPVGASVEVFEIRGATAVVHPVGELRS